MMTGTHGLHVVIGGVLLAVVAFKLAKKPFHVSTLGVHQVEHLQGSPIGIEAKDIPKVLMPFGQAHRAFTRAHEGFGLGLSLVHSLTEEHGGALEIDSTPGEGTTVIVRFPAERTASNADAAQ